MNSVDYGQIEEIILWISSHRNSSFNDATHMIFGD